MARPDWRRHLAQERKLQYRHPKIYGRTPSHEPTARRLPTKRIVLGALVVFGLSALIWFVLGSDVFTVKSIRIVGSVTPAVREEVESLQGEHILLFSTGDMATRLRQAQSSIDRLELSKGLPSTLLVTVTQRQPVLLWESGGIEYAVDRNGVAFVVTDETQPVDTLPRVVDQGAVPTVPGRMIASPSFIHFVHALAEQFPEEFPVGLTQVAIGQSTFELAAHTDDGWYALFDTQRSIPPQLESLQSVFERYHADIHEYVDLRVSGKAYFK